MQINSFRFNLQELGGALGDLGTLLPLMVALILVNGLNATTVLVGVGLFYIGSGLYYRIPTPVQPLKAASAIAISLGLSASVIGAAGLLMGAILLLLSLTNLIALVVKLFPHAVVRGIQLSIGLILLRKGVDLAFFGEQTFISGVSRSLGFGSAALAFLSLLPLSVLGVLLAIVGIYHTFLIRDLKAKRQLAVAGTVAVVAIALVLLDIPGNLAYGFGAGILLHYLLKLFQKSKGSLLGKEMGSGPNDATL